METLENLWASIVAGLRERTTNPLTMAFVISWCLWNYRFFMVILGADTTTQRLKTLEEMYPFVRDTYMGGALLYPALSALVYVFIYPLIGMVSIWVYRKYQVTTANLVKNAEKTRTITPQERDTLVRAHEKERKKLTEEKEALSAQITAIRATLDITVEQLEKFSSAQPISDATQGNSEGKTTQTAQINQNLDTKSRAVVLDDKGMPEFDDDKLSLLLNISKYTSKVSLDVLAGNMKMNPTIANSELRSLLEAGLVDRSDNGFWGLTESGEALAVKLLKNASRY